MTHTLAEETILYKDVVQPLVKGFKSSADLELTVSGGGTPSEETQALDVRGAKALALTVDHNVTGSDSTSLEVSPFASYDGVKFDNEAYGGSITLGASKVKTVPITAGINYVKFKAENKDASNATKLRLYCVVVW